MGRFGVAFGGRLFIGAVILAPGAAAAHDVWADGSPVPPWVKQLSPAAWTQETCAQCHSDSIDDVSEQADGYHIKNYPYVVPLNDALPSQDGKYWIFYPTFANGGMGHYFWLLRAALDVSKRGAAAFARCLATLLVLLPQDWPTK